MTLTRNKIITIAVVAVLFITFSIFAIVSQRPAQSLGSVEVGSQYLSTTTPAVADLANICPFPLAAAGGAKYASSTTGVLGNVNILRSGGGILAIYDATTTNVALRSADQSTSTITLAYFGESPTAGTYQFDIGFKRGLLIDYSSAGAGISSTTISYRCEQ